MTIGNNNVFEVDCEVHCKSVGDNNIVESKGTFPSHNLCHLFSKYLFFFLAYVGRQTVITNGCVIGAKCEVLLNDTLAEGSLFYGSGSDVKWRIQADKPSVSTITFILVSCILILIF